MAVLGVDRLAFPEADAAPGHPHDLVGQAFQMHLDPPCIGAPDGAMGKAIQPEIGRGLAVQPGQKVQVEGGGDAFRVVIGGDQSEGVFLQIHADQQMAIMAQHTGRAAQEGDRLVGQQVADGRSGEKAQPATGHAGWRIVQGQGGHLHEIAMHRPHGQPRMVAGQGGAGRHHVLDRNVDRHIGHRIAQRIQHQPGLDRRAAAEFDQRGAASGAGGDLGRPHMQDPGLGAGGVIGGKAGDAVEQA